MLSWLRRRWTKSGSPGAARRAGPPGLRVSFDDETIVVREPSGAMPSLSWDELASVVILSTDAGPVETDLFWLLQSRDRNGILSVPMGAEGEHELLQAMQARLPDFDNFAVIEAMGSAGNATFTVWEASAPAKRPVI